MSLYSINVYIDVVNLPLSSNLVMSIIKIKPIIHKQMTNWSRRRHRSEIRQVCPEVESQKIVTQT